MTRTAVLLLLCWLLIGPARQVVAQAPPVSDSAHAASVRRLLEVMHAPALALAAMESGIEVQRRAMPQVPPEFWTEFVRRARQQVDTLQEMLVPIYARQFNEQETLQLIDFYKSPLGQHLIEVQPILLRDGSAAGQRWGAALGVEVGAWLEAKQSERPVRP